MSPINALREDDELAALSASPELDDLAARYLAAMIEARCLCPAAAGADGARRLADDVRLSVRSDAVVLDAGVMVGYDRDAAAAITTLVHDPANAAAILGTRLQLVGVATAGVPTGRLWLAPPPGGVGPDIDLAGYTLVVIVTAGLAD